MKWAEAFSEAEKRAAEGERVCLIARPNGEWAVWNWGAFLMSDIKQVRVGWYSENDTETNERWFNHAVRWMEQQQ